MTDVGLLVNFNLFKLHEFKWQKTCYNQTDCWGVNISSHRWHSHQNALLPLVGFSWFVFWESLVKPSNAPRANTSHSYSVQGSLWAVVQLQKHISSMPLHKLPRYILSSSQMLRTSPIFLRSAANIACFAPDISFLIFTRKGLQGKKFECLRSPPYPFQYKFFQNFFTHHFVIITSNKS